MNMDENQKLKQKKEGEMLGEKIENYLEKLKKREVSQNITDAFYDQFTEKGIPFYLRKMNLLRDMPSYKKNQDESIKINSNKTLNIPDELLERQLHLKMEADENATRDRTFEEFKNMYGDHLLGKVDPHLRT